ncbi:MAG: YjbH domain-containing protein [Algoriphagus sp.]|uniref:YjbH domain-containing protein n=1 Tax=Algoriphagus sp. TaxID=1872435 RepID=UPI00260A3BC3|nr:YjbH domain-containing protein [Algoriphagus sp.]MDG1277488.1 YjbH domain-containing protein [Algoriphagus sp.]
MIKFIFFISFLLILTVAQAQDKELLNQSLRKAGFEQVLIIPVRSSSEGIVYLVGIEHRGINNPSETLRLANSISLSRGFFENKFVLLNKGIALYSSEFENGKFSTKNLSEEFQRDINRNFSPSNYRFNVYIEPDIQVRFGDFENPVESKTAVSIASEIVLFKGFSLNTGILLPLQNDLDNETSNVKLGASYFDYFSKFSNNHYFQFSFGLFHNDRYGTDIEYRYMPLNSRLSFGLRYAKTGFYYFPENAVFFDSINDDLLLANLEYLFPKERISLSLDFGQFLFADSGLRASSFKQFKNIEIGLFATFTQTGNTAGFNFMIPIFPGKILRSNFFEFRTNDSFRWEYTYSNEGEIGRDFNSKRSLKNTLRRYNSNLLNSF